MTDVQHNSVPSKQVDIHMRSGVDRRGTGEDRRESLSVDYFYSSAGIEQRRTIERRQTGERRKGWGRIARWSSSNLSCTRSPFF